MFNVIQILAIDTVPGNFKAYERVLEAQQPICYMHKHEHTQYELLMAHCKS